MKNHNDKKSIKSEEVGPITQIQKNYKVER